MAIHEDSQQTKASSMQVCGIGKIGQGSTPGKRHVPYLLESDGCCLAIQPRHCQHEDHQECQGIGWWLARGRPAFTVPWLFVRVTGDMVCYGHGFYMQFCMYGLCCSQFRTGSSTSPAGHVSLPRHHSVLVAINLA